MIREIMAPEFEYPTASDISVFLAGSIEMGKAVEWQKELVENLKQSDLENVMIYNPRRNDWDSSWIQDPAPGTKFFEQVTWELQHISFSDVVFMYFAPGTQSPISLLELGLILGRKKRVIVVCPKDFYRYGNVKLTVDSCRLSNRHILFCENFDNGVLELKEEIRKIKQGQIEAVTVYN